MITNHTFLNYFENLPAWDGTDHINRLASYIKLAKQEPGINEQARFKNQFKKMFVRSIACALETDFNKHCFTLVCEQQNSGKSTFLRWLCPPELWAYYSENTGLTKNDRIALAEDFIINIDELDAMAKYDINALRSIISKDSFKERLPYTKRTELLKRRCNFVASTNRHKFLTDETGSACWICFHIDSINWNYKTEVNINDVWAQAYYLHKSGFIANLTREEIAENEERNKLFTLSKPNGSHIPGRRPAMSEKFDPQSPEGQDLLKFLYLTSSYITSMSDHIERVLAAARVGTRGSGISPVISESVKIVSSLKERVKKFEKSIQ